jgi:hypothetical protein
MPWSAPPSNWFLTPSGFEIGPQSCAPTSLVTVMTPLAAFTSTSATMAT